MTQPSVSAITALPLCDKANYLHREKCKGRGLRRFPNPALLVRQL